MLVKAGPLLHVSPTSGFPSSCMEDYPRDVYRIRVGDWDMQVPEVQEQEFRVDTIHFHEQYNVGIPLNNDIAVVRVKVGFPIEPSQPSSLFNQ